MRDIREIKEFAINKGYDKVKKLPIKYEGMDVYEPYFLGGEVCVGYPLVIFDNGNELRMSTADES